MSCRCESIAGLLCVTLVFSISKASRTEGLFGLKGTNLPFIENASFFLRNSEVSDKALSLFHCLLLCIKHATEHSTVCAGASTGQNGTGCIELYPPVSDITGLLIVQGEVIDVIYTGVYLYQPEIGRYTLYS